MKPAPGGASTLLKVPQEKRKNKEWKQWIVGRKGGKGLGDRTMTVAIMILRF